MSDAAPPKALVDLARRNTRGDVSPRRHQASRARLLDHLSRPRRSRAWTAFAFAVAAVTMGGGAAAFGAFKPPLQGYTADASVVPVRQTAEPAHAASERPAQAPSDEADGVKLEVTPEYATLFWDDKKLTGNPSTFRFEPDHKVHRVRAEAPGHAPKTQLVVMDSPYVLVEMQLSPLPVTLGPVTSSSSIIDADEISSGLHDAFQSCYTSALDETPTLGGKATVMLHVAENGTIESVDVTDKEGLNARVTTCLASSAADLHFRVSRGGFVKIPLVFRAK